MESVLVKVYPFTRAFARAVQKYKFYGFFGLDFSCGIGYNIVVERERKRPQGRVQRVCREFGSPTQHKGIVQRGGNANRTIPLKEIGNLEFVSVHRVAIERNGSTPFSPCSFAFIVPSAVLPPPRRGIRVAPGRDRSY